MRSVAILAFDGAQSLDVSGPAEVLAGATQQLAATGGTKEGYDVSIVSTRGGPVRTESAITLMTDSIAALPPRTGDLRRHRRGHRPALRLWHRRAHASHVSVRAPRLIDSSEPVHPNPESR